MEWLAVIGSVSAILLGWFGFARTVKNSIKSDAKESANVETAIKADMDFIKHGVNEIRLEQKDQGRRFDALAERVTRVEESAKQSHLRIDRMERGNMQ